MTRDQQLIELWTRNKYLLLITGLLILFTNQVHANIKLPALISDNMVLQQQTSIILWGRADQGEQIRIKASWLSKEVETMADASGNWQVTIKTIKAGGPYSITFSGTNVIEVKNVLLGEVWLASGQSNMEFYMGKGAGWKTGVLNYEEEIAKANYPEIRMIDVPNIVSDTVLDDFEGQWQICTPSTAGNFSAVAYYFAAKVHQDTGFPVGIVNATWGGTPAESWTRKGVLEKGFKPILDRYQKVCDDYPEAFKNYQAKLDIWKADTSSKKKAAPKEPIGPRHNKSPYKLYNGMIAPLLSFRFKGVIWYQGESNATYAWQYRRLFPAMIKDWRVQFHLEDMPFYFVQIAPHKGQNPVIREAQLYTLRSVPNTGMVVTTDVGDSTDIHPRDKKTVGERLARWALHNNYGRRNLEVSGPLYKSREIKGNKIVLQFGHAEGLTLNTAAPEDFTIAANDQQFVKAKVLIKGKTVIVWSDDIMQPVAVRFGWRNVPHAELYNKDGLPASPFRTDTWPVETQDKN